MGRPAKGLPGRVTVKLKGKRRKVDLSKSGVGLGKVHIDIKSHRGSKVVEIVRIPEDQLDIPSEGDHNSQ